MKVGDRVKNINSGYLIESGPKAMSEVEAGVITDILGQGDVEIQWDGCEKPYIAFYGQFDLAQRPREFWIDPYGYAHDNPKDAKPTSPMQSAIHVREVIE